MPLQITQVDDECRATVDYLLGLYAHDLSEFTSQEPDDNGRYSVAGWTEQAASPLAKQYLVTLRGKPAGFVFSQRLTSNQAQPSFAMTDVFILRCYRGLGIAEEVVLRVVGMQPGAWSAKVDVENVGGLAFWRHVLRRHAGRNYRELTSPCGSSKVFEFVSTSDGFVRG